MSGTLLVVVVYDIVCDRRRGRVHRLLSEYGVPIQKSAFEARLTVAERRSLVDQLGRAIASEDSVIVYGITHDQEERILNLGRPRIAASAPRFFVV